jgi:hypothetical protein
MHRITSSSRSVLGLGLLYCVGVAPTHAQQAQVFAYPSAGQSQEQQNRDRFECHQWSVSQSGFDPTVAPPISAPPPPGNYGYSDQPPPPQQQGGGFLGLGNGGFFRGGGVVGDAATGAALGAAGGAIAGDAGQGAAIGALASTVFGAVSRSAGNSQQAQNQSNYQQQQAQQQQYQQQQADQMYQDQMRRTADYNQAFGACMKARNYTVN